MTRPPSPETVPELAVDYVLGELGHPEAGEFEQRLTRDPELAAEVASLRSTLALLPYGAETTPPAHLRAAVLRAAQAAHDQRATTRRVRARWSWIVTAAAALLGVAFGLDSYRVRQELGLQEKVTALLHEPNVVRSFALRGASTASRAFGSVALDLDARKGAIVIRGLPALPADRTYRLWALVGDEPVPCGQFAADPEEGAAAQFAVPVESYVAPISKLFVTVEPASLPPRPTGPTVMTSA